MRYFKINGPFCANGTDFDFEPADSTDVGDAPKCAVCGSFCGMLRLVPPIRGTLRVERSTFDLSITSGADVLLSERCLRAFEMEGIQGLVDITPIDVVGIEGPIDPAQIGRYFLADAVRWGAEIDRAKSGIRTSEDTVCPGCGYAGLIDGYARICIADGSWTGLDVFRAKGLPGTVLATERVKRLLTGKRSISL